MFCSGQRSRKCLDLLQRMNSAPNFLQEQNVDIDPLVSPYPVQIVFECSLCQWTTYFSTSERNKYFLTAGTLCEKSLVLNQVMSMSYNGQRLLKVLVPRFMVLGRNKYRFSAFGNQHQHKCSVALVVDICKVVCLQVYCRATKH